MKEEAPERGVRRSPVTIDTADGIRLEGALWGEGRVGFLLCAPTGEEFDCPWLAWLGQHLPRHGFAVLSLNRRDHGKENGAHPFLASAMDHRYGMEVLEAAGSRSVILLGHSYGALTAMAYAQESRNSAIAALILCAPLDDLRRCTEGLVGGNEAYRKVVETATTRIAQGRGGETFVLGPIFPGGRPLLHTYEAFLEKRGPQSRARPHELAAACGAWPILAVRDPGDPSPMMSEPVGEAFRHLDYRWLPAAPGGRPPRRVHSFHGREAEVLDVVLPWLRERGIVGG
jgi:pimeloyl-ACP methyl ester carboxylesterase